MNRREVGAEYERRAASYLEERGCKIIEKNYRCKMGEVDLIIRDEEYLVFVEVKYRRDEKAGNPLEAVNLSKQRRISKAAAWYLYSHGQEGQSCRFDVIGICGNQIAWVKDAFFFAG